MRRHHRIVDVVCASLLLATACEDEEPTGQDTSMDTSVETDATNTTDATNATDATNTTDATATTDATNTTDATTTTDATAEDTGEDTATPADPVETFANPPELTADGDGVYQLRAEPGILEVDGQRYCVRTFNGSVPGGTLRIPASSDPRSIRVDYTNGFTRMDMQEVAPGTSYDFNQTNLHTHGFHVQPERTTDDAYYGDNVLIHLMGGQKAEYRYDIDEDVTHFDGTMWYHPHVHGATAIQVGSGMAGAIIIEGPTDELDGIKDTQERIFLMQHIPYNQATPLGNGADCNEDSFSINDFRTLAGTTPTLVNGILEPRLVVAPGAVERWRLIHGGVTNEMSLRLVPGTGPDTDACSSFGTQAATLHQYAADGITFDSLDARTSVFLATGNRKDVFFEAPTTEGTWCLVGQTPGPPGPGPGGTDTLIAEVVVHASAGTATGALPSDSDLASVAMPILDCNATPNSTQNVIFAQALDADGNACEGTSPNGGPALNIDCKQYDAEDPRLLSVETLEAWNVNTEGGPHPMHIHINPFTVCDAMEDGQPLRPQWRDTLLVTGETQLRMYYETYTGSFVMHCHKLHHEDGGMMEKITIQ